MTNFIILMVFIGILVILISQAISIYLVYEKGRELYIGIILGFFPIIGQLIAAFIKPTDNELFNELYGRDLISKDEFDTLTKEINIEKITEK